MDPVALSADQTSRLVAAIDRYDSNAQYDSVFLEVHDKIVLDGEAGKADIAVIAFWKRLRCDTKWVRELLSVPEMQVRVATRRAFVAPDDCRALAALAGLPGFASWGAMATALLCAYDPERWPVMDRNARAGLRELGRELGGGTLGYFREVRLLCGQIQEARPATTVRDVDKGLYMLGKG